MKHLALLVAMVVTLGFAGGCIEKYSGAFSDLTSAVTISDEELLQISRQMREEGDKQEKVAIGSNKYATRLARLTKKLQKEDGLDLNFKAYITSDINANATADGSIRVYSGIMDLMTDDELFFILGHEIGHVKDGDSLDKIRTAYITSGALKAAAASHSSVGAVLNTAQLGELLENVVNGQFSQKQELDADLYGYNLMKKYMVNPQAAVSALQKLDSLGSSGGITASHPNSGERAKRIAQAIESNK